jgi:hypothetical protein
VEPDARFDMLAAFISGRQQPALKVATLQPAAHAWQRKDGAVKARIEDYGKQFTAEGGEDICLWSLYRQQSGSSLRSVRENTGFDEKRRSISKRKGPRTLPSRKPYLI